MKRSTLQQVALVLAALAGAGCVDSQRGLGPGQAAAIQDSVRAALADYRRYSAAAQWDSVVRLYSTDLSLRWIEDGRRYSGGLLRQTLGGLHGLRIETTYDSTEVVALAPGLATLTTYYDTRFVGASPPVHFAGAISMIWAHEPAGWRIRGGHSSVPVPHAR